VILRTAAEAVAEGRQAFQTSIEKVESQNCGRQWARDFKSFKA
jgi:hypothetical protein